MESPNSLSLAEIRKYMLENGCKVTNHALVKHFKRFLTNPDTQNEARKQFKTYVNILATIKNENNQKYLILRKKYLNECPTEEMALQTEVPSSPGGMSIGSEGLASPFRQPPPYKPPPEVLSPSVAKLPVLQSESAENYRECINEFAAAVRLMDSSSSLPREESPLEGEDEKMKSVEENSEQMAIMSKPVVSTNLARDNSIENENKENVARFSFSSGTSSMESGDKVSSDAENQISVKEATRKFNRLASEEEARIVSPPAKKKAEKLIEEKMTPEVTLSHPKGKEWVVSSAKANYQELAKLAADYPELVKLQDPTTGYTALHWAAKHGNEDVVKLIAGTYKADVNARTNGGYTPVHLAMQFGRENIFALLCNVYKANRDLMDWSGNKPLDYLKQRTSVSASTYSSEYDLLMPQLPSKFRNLTAGGSLGLSRKKRSQNRYATMSGSSLIRTQSLMINKKRKTLQAMINDESLLVPCPSPDRPTPSSNSELFSPNQSPSYSKFDSDSPKEYYGAIPSRRKESFLRKTFRAASNKSEVANNNSE